MIPLHRDLGELKFGTNFGAGGPVSVACVREISFRCKAALRQLALSSALGIGYRYLQVVFILCVCAPLRSFPRQFDLSSGTPVLSQEISICSQESPSVLHLF